MEHSATKSVRKHLISYGAHVVRLEDKLTPGIPDLNFCYRGCEVWLEGKFVRLPKRDSTVITFGSSIRTLNQSEWMRKRRLAGGCCYFWIRVEGGQWYILDDLEMLREGLSKKQLLQLPSFATAKQLVAEIIKRTVNDTHTNF